MYVYIAIITDVNKIQAKYHNVSIRISYFTPFQTSTPLINFTPWRHLISSGYSLDMLIYIYPSLITSLVDVYWISQIDVYQISSVDNTGISYGYPYKQWK